MVAPISGKTAYWEMYTSARNWSKDIASGSAKQGAFLDFNAERQSGDVDRYICIAEKE